MKAIINRGKKFSTLGGVIRPTEEVTRVVNEHIKAGAARVLVDTEDTLMYALGEASKSNLHPIFEQALKPWGIR
jgi:hypothetical protein